MTAPKRDLHFERRQHGAFEEVLPHLCGESVVSSYVQGKEKVVVEQERERARSRLSTFAFSGLLLISSSRTLVALPRN